MTKVCGTCGKEIEICPECGGKICVPDCPDRVHDGCTCDVGEDSDE